MRIALVLASLLLLGGPSSVWACECFYRPLRDVITRSELVFEGTAERRASLDAFDDSRQEEYAFLTHLRVRRVWKGSLGLGQMVSIYRSSPEVGQRDLTDLPA